MMHHNNSIVKIFSNQTFIVKCKFVYSKNVLRLFYWDFSCIKLIFFCIQYHESSGFQEKAIELEEMIIGELYFSDHKHLPYHKCNYFLQLYKKSPSEYQFFAADYQFELKILNYFKEA